MLPLRQSARALAEGPGKRRVGGKRAGEGPRQKGKGRGEPRGGEREEGGGRWEAGDGAGREGLTTAMTPDGTLGGSQLTNRCHTRPCAPTRCAARDNPKLTGLRRLRSSRRCVFLIPGDFQSCRADAVLIPGDFQSCHAVAFLIPGDLKS